jgi:hypothetical protein
MTKPKLVSIRLIVASADATFSGRWPNSSPPEGRKETHDRLRKLQANAATIKRIGRIPLFPSPLRSLPASVTIQQYSGHWREKLKS